MPEAALQTRPWCPHPGLPGPGRAGLGGREQPGAPVPGFRPGLSPSGEDAAPRRAPSRAGVLRSRSSRPPRAAQVRGEGRVREGPAEPGVGRALRRAMASLSAAWTRGAEPRCPGAAEARGGRGARRAGMGCWRGFSFRTRGECASFRRSRIRSCGAVLPAAPAAYGQVFVPQSWPGSSPCEVAVPPPSSWEPPRI